MTLYFGETFKRNRQERGLTQEQIAEVFCVSPQAVSRWECSAAYPDIALLPTIADYFGISIEELLGVNIARRQAKIGEYMAQFQDAVNHGLAEDCIEIARAAVKDFPKDYALQNMLMYALFLSGDDSGNIPNWKENQEKYKEEIIEIGNMILRECTDDVIRLDAKSRLGFHYCEIGEVQKGREIIESLPSEDSSKESMLYWALHGSELHQYLRSRIAAVCRSLIWCIWRYVQSGDTAPTLKDKIGFLDRCENIVRLIYSDEADFRIWCGEFARIDLETKIPLYLEMGDTQAAIRTFERAAKYLQLDSELLEPYVCVSPLVAGDRFTPVCDTVDTRPLAQTAVEDYISRSCYDVLRDDGRFTEALRAIESIYKAPAQAEDGK